MAVGHCFCGVPAAFYFLQFLFLLHIRMFCSIMVTVCVNMFAFLLYGMKKESVCSRILQSLTLSLNRTMI